MKTIIIIVCLAAFSNLYLQAQIWNAIDTTGITNLNGSGEGENERIALFANNYGIHVLKVLYTGNDKHVTYYRLNSSGELDTTLTESFDDYGDFPNIAGDENNLYAAYRKNDTIKVQFSSNGGSDWSSVESRTFSNGDVNCNGVDAAYSDFGGLHIVWSEKVGNKYEAYFERFDGDTWVNFKNITDVASADSGGFPTVTTSLVSGTNRAHVTINTGNADGLGDNQGRGYSRDYDYSNWSDPVAIIPSDSSKMDRLLVTGDDYIHSFYYAQAGLPPFKNRRKLVTSSTWGSETTIEDQVLYTLNTHKIPITKTSDDTLHAFYFSTSPGFWQTKKFSTSSSWSSPFDVSDGGVSWKDAAVTSVSNDIYVMYAQGIGTNFANNYKYRQYDAAPLTPPNFAGTNDNNRPKLTWNKIEPDIEYFEIWRMFLASGYPAGWTLLATTTSESFIDYDIWLGGSSVGKVLYKSRSKDFGNNFSPYTNVVTFRFSGLNKIGTGQVLNEFVLKNNHPNPFNPSTQISYSLAQDAYVTLKVYDVLGTEVAKLINAKQTAGRYEINFNSEGLSSGVYIYRITASNNGRILFTDSKQMILLR